MRLHHFRIRTSENPLTGVEFDDAENAQIQRWSSRVAQGERTMTLEGGMYAAQDGDEESYDRILAEFRVMLMLWAATDKALRRQD